MQRDLFLGIRAAITLHPTDMVPAEVKQRDPLWHCRSILNNILKKCTSLTVSDGVSALDDSSIRAKSRSAARTFIPSKPEKYAQKHHCRGPFGTLYGDFPRVRRPMAGRCAQGGLDSKKAIALWVAMLDRQNQKLPAPIVMDSYGTRHGLTKPIHEMTRGETRVIGTRRLNYVDNLSRSSVEAAVLAL
ncbi:Transposase IS4 [Phytophthora infestans]|uniref:Transposase IS4 n=1 Tax=Phytophthora infestans TaxID=4787 RepID=A0A8S9TYI5_PHYIN|nr:Transposase IS4 [Phytophthora infestans]